MAKKKVTRKPSRGRKKSPARSPKRTQGTTRKAAKPSAPPAKRAKKHARKIVKPKSSPATLQRKRAAKLGRHVKKAPVRLRVPARLTPADAQKLKSALKTVRKHVHGYDTRDGYRVSDLTRLPAKTRKRLLKRAQTLKELEATPHDLVQARTPKARRSLLQFTRQRIRGAKHFIVHKPWDNYRVSIRDGHVSVRGAFPGRVATESRYFLFPKRPKTPDEVKEFAANLLKEMPNGFYVILTGLLGDTGEPVEKGMLLKRLGEYLSQYSYKGQTDVSTGFAEAVIGFRFMSSRLAGVDIEMGTKDSRRQSQREYNAMWDQYHKDKLAGKDVKEPKYTPTYMRFQKREKARLKAQREYRAKLKRRKARGKK